MAYELQFSWEHVCITLKKWFDRKACAARNLMCDSTWISLWFFEERRNLALTNEKIATIAYIYGLNLKMLYLSFSSARIPTRKHSDFQTAKTNRYLVVFQKFSFHFTSSKEIYTTAWHFHRTSLPQRRNIREFLEKGRWIFFHSK